MTHRPTFWPLAAGLFLLIVTVRLALVLRGLPEMPVYDQWAAIDGIAVPLARGDFDPAYLLAPHNEHVLFWTKLLDWMQLRLSQNQLDARPAGLLIAVLYAAAAAALLAGALRYVGLARLPMLVSGLGLTMLPYAWENLTEAWGNSYLLLIVAAAGTLYIAAHARRASAVPALLLALVVSTLAMGTGGLAPALGAGIVLARLRRNDLSRQLASILLLMLLAAVVTSVLLLLHHTPAAPRVPARRLLSLMQMAIATIVFMPSLLLALDVWRRVPSASALSSWRHDAWTSMLGVWGWLHVLAMIAARPEFRIWFPVSRYMDILSVAMLANLACALALAAREAPYFRAGAVVSVARIFAAVVLLAAPLPVALYAWQVQRWDAAQALVTTAIHGADASALERSDASLLPFPNREYLKARLADARVQQILGDRIGTRDAAPRFVLASRRVESWLATQAPWLMPLALAIGAALVCMAFRTGRAVQRQEPRPA